MHYWIMKTIQHLPKIIKMLLTILRDDGMVVIDIVKLDVVKEYGERVCLR